MARKKLQEGDFRINRKAGRVEMYNPAGKWVKVGRSMRTIKASKKAELAKKQAQLANMKTTIAKKTVKGLPSAVRKIGRKLKSPFSRAIEQNIKQYQKRFRPATPEQMKIMKKFGKIK